MESWQQILAAYPFLRTIWDAVVIIAPLATLIAYAGIFFLSATAKIIAIARRRSAYGKCSTQLAMLGVIAGWVLLAASRVWLYYTQGERPADGIANFLAEMSWIFFSMGVLLSSIYFSLRNVLKNMPVLYATIGMIAAVQNCVALIITLFTLRVAHAAISPDASKLALPDLFPNNWDDPLWSAFCYTLPLILAMAGALACCWLVMRRKKDDYGRDYYNTMLPWCAAWARNAWLLLWLLLLVSTGMQLWPKIGNGVFNAPEALFDNARLVLWLLPPICWTIVKKSAVPLRHSWLVFAALILCGLFMIPYYLQLTSL